MLLFCAGSPIRADDPFNLEYRYDSRTILDSTRKDYGEITYDPNTFLPVQKEKAYDKTFVAFITDLNLALKGDLGPGQFLDFKETLHYQTYRPEDYLSFSNTAYKYSYLDHLFNVTYGFSVGEVDAIRLDYFHNIYRIPIDRIWDYTSHKVQGRYEHKIHTFAGLGMEGSYEEREYHNYPSLNYREGGFSLDYSSFFPERVRYQPVSSSARGERRLFERTPTGMKTRKAVDYYTTWTRIPHQEDPEGKYLVRVLRGDLYLNLKADFRARELTSVDNAYSQPSAIFGLTYDATDHIRVTLEDTYYQRDYDRESTPDFHFDHESNKIVLTSRHRSRDRFLYLFTLMNEWYGHTRQKAQDYQINTVRFETYYSYGRSAASLYLNGVFTRYGEPRTFYVNSDEYQAVFSYDYPMTRSFIFHLKDEWTDKDYREFADEFYSSYVRNVWRASVEKLLSDSQSLELGYQSTRERHRVFWANNIVEKSLFFSWNSHF